MKIVSKGNTISTTEYLEKKQKARRKKLAWIAGLVFVLLIILVLLSRIEKFRIHDVSVSGTEVVNTEAVAVAAQEALSGYYFYLVPRNNFLVYPHSKIISVLADKFPRLSQIEVSLDGSQALVVKALEREPFALYCVSVESNTCYFLDKEGFVFDFAPSFSSGVYFVYTKEGLTDPLGEALLASPEDFQALSAFITKLSQLGLNALSLQISESEYKMNLKNGGKILWLRDSDLAHIFSNLESFLKSPEIKSEKDFLERIAILDLRTENKVFYTFREE
jgi:cell division septal protein FtsQ